MKLTHVFSSCAILFLLLVAPSWSDAKTYCVHLTNSGFYPGSLKVEVGDIIAWPGNEYGYIHYIAVTDPAGVRSEGGGICGSDSMTYTVKMAGDYTFQDSVAQPGPIIKYYGTISASPNPTSSVQYNDNQSSGLRLTVGANPSNGATMIILNADRPLNLQLALFDAAGKQVQSYEAITVTSSQHSMPLSSEVLPNGTYYLMAKAGGALVASTKVLIVH
jgi:hypothetical protein